MLTVASFCRCLATLSCCIAEMPLFLLTTPRLPAVATLILFRFAATLLRDSLLRYAISPAATLPLRAEFAYAAAADVDVDTMLAMFRDADADAAAALMARCYAATLLIRFVAASAADAAEYIFAATL